MKTNKHKEYVKYNPSEAGVEETKAEAPTAQQIVFNNTPLKNHIYSFVIQKKCYWCNENISGLVSEYQYHSGTDLYSRGLFRIYECGCKYVYNCYYFEKIMALIRSHYYKTFLFHDGDINQILEYCSTKFNTNLILTDYNEIIDCLEFIIKFEKCKKPHYYQLIYDKCIEFGNMAYNLYNSCGDDDYYLGKTSIIKQFIKHHIKKIVIMVIKRLEENQQLRLHFNDFYDRMYDKIEECCVCYEKCVTTTKCKHSICGLCFKQVQKCPLCRAEASGDILYTSYRKQYINFEYV